MKHSSDFIDHYDNQDASELVDINDCIRPDEFYGQSIWDGKKLISEKEAALIQKENTGSLE